MPDWPYIFIIIYLYLWIFSSSWSYLNLFRRSMKVFWVAPTNVFVPLARTWYKLSVSVLLPLSWLWELQSPDLGELTSGFQWAHKSKTNITLTLFTVMSYWIISKDVYLCYFSFEVWTQTASELQPLGGFERKFSSLKKKKKLDLDNLHVDILLTWSASLPLGGGSLCEVACRWSQASATVGECCL